MNYLLPLFAPIFLESSCFGCAIVLIALWRRSSKMLMAAWLCFIAISFDYFFLLFPRSIGFFHLNWNWEGKFGEIVWSLFLIYLLKWVNPIEAGLCVPKAKGMLWGATIGLTYTVMTVLEMIISHQLPPKSMLNLETIMFQFTLPGFAEELFCRGVLLAILNHYLGYRWQFLKIRWGIGAILVTVLFLWGHVFYCARGEHLLSMHLDNLSFDIIFMSISLIFLREKTGSIWPGVLCHNLANGLPLVVSWLFL